MIVSTTLAGPGVEASIVDALRSCSHLVDAHLVLSNADPKALRAALDGAGIKFIGRTWEWPNSYGEARNAALRWAEDIGADWALTVDCDERIDIPALELPSGFDALTVGDRDILYQKPRLLRCGAGLRWEWPCAERLVGPDGKPPAMARIPGAFWELPKDAASEQRRARRGVEHMPKILAEEDNAHARRHLAECLLILERHEEAAEQFARVANTPGAPLFEVTWCRYRLAELACVAGNFEPARQIAACALAEDPGLIQELGWVIAHSNAQLKNYTAAALWASYVLEAPIDQSRGGHRSKTWREGAQKLLASIEAAANRKRPQEMTAAHFAARADFAPDYAILARALVETLSFASCLDLGAGNGLLVGALVDAAVNAIGIEASAEAKAATPAELWRRIEFGTPLERWGTFGMGADFDLVTCIEVGEHIPADRADGLVAACVARARRSIVFSAAQPGQGGIGHVNEQPPEYWGGKFATHGCRIDWDSTHQLRKKLEGVKACWWLPRNIMVLTARESTIAPVGGRF